MTEEEFQAHMRSLHSATFRDSSDPKVFTGSGYFYRSPRNRVVCADGFSVSVQGGWGKYSDPRCDDSDTYLEWELGYPSEKPTDEVMEFAENPDAPTETVYGYVPTAAVIRLLEAHGGIAGKPE